MSVSIDSDGIYRVYYIQSRDRIITIYEGDANGYGMYNFLPTDYIYVGDL